MQICFIVSFIIWGYIQVFFKYRITEKSFNHKRSGRQFYSSTPVSLKQHHGVVSCAVCWEDVLDSLLFIRSAITKFPSYFTVHFTNWLTDVWASRYFRLILIKYPSNEVFNALTCWSTWGRWLFIIYDCGLLFEVWVSHACDCKNVCCDVAPRRYIRVFCRNVLPYSLGHKLDVLTWKL